MYSGAGSKLWQIWGITWLVSAIHPQPVLYPIPAAVLTLASTREHNHSSLSRVSYSHRIPSPILLCFPSSYFEQHQWKIQSEELWKVESLLPKARNCVYGNAMTLWTKGSLLALGWQCKLFSDNLRNSISVNKYMPLCVFVNVRIFQKRNTSIYLLFKVIQNSFHNLQTYQSNSKFYN